MACRSRLGPIARRVSTPALLRSVSASKPGLSTSTLRCLSGTPTRRFRDSAPCKAAGSFTTDSYPEIKRDPRFAQITKEHVAYFRDLLGKDSAIVDGVTAEVAVDDMEPYNGDWMRKYRGHCKLVLKPESTEEVSKILKYCNDNLLAVVPQGGNTGLVGGSVPVFDEIVVSTSRMNQIRSFDEVTGVLVADAGVVLEVADQFLAEKDYLFPLDLGAKGSCHIGGNVSTNAGGLRLLRYGSLHGTVLGVQAVLPDGTILNDLCTLRKNNTGYDLKQLFIGGEGTIGMITAVSIQCPQRPKAVNVAFLGADSFGKIQQAFREAKSQLSEILSAFELMDSYSQDMVHRVRQTKRPLDGEHPFYCLIETSGSNSEHDAEKLERFLEDVMSKEVIADGVVAQDQTQIKSLWSQREGITESVGHFGGVYKYDVSIPMKDLYRLVDETRERIVAAGLKGDTDDFPVVEVVGYGHMGDCNLHLNIAVRRYDKRVEELLEPFVYEWIGKVNGSISAEHGIGIAKKKYLGFSRNNTMIDLLKQIKKLYDPVSSHSKSIGNEPRTLICDTEWNHESVQICIVIQPTVQNLYLCHAYAKLSLNFPGNIVAA
jgi:FAD/FMN-containing dehydrogenase